METYICANVQRGEIPSTFSKLKYIVTNSDIVIHCLSNSLSTTLFLDTLFLMYRQMQWCLGHDSAL